MTSTAPGSGPDWVPDACTLPTVERPVRLAELDDLFAAMIDVERTDATHAILTLAGTEELAARAHDLAARETACCSFLTFTITPVDPAPGSQERARVSIAVPDAHAAALAALVDRAEHRAAR